MFRNKTLLLENIEINIKAHFSKLSGIRILHFSDLHLVCQNKCFDNFFIELSKVECDLIIISGDMIYNDKGIVPCVEYLGCLKSRYGIFVTYGNHDKYCLGLKETIFAILTKKFKMNNLSLLKSRLKKKGINILDNEIAGLYINNTKINLIGINFPLGYDRFTAIYRSEKELDYLRNLINKVSGDDYNILISHIPDLIQEFDTHNISLILSSHTHGGQIRLPLLGPLFVHSSFQKKYNMGIFKYNNSYLHVSSGLGVSIAPFRFRCLPRASVITLNTDKDRP